MKSARKITLARAKRVHMQAHESRGAVSLEASHLRERSKASYFLHGISSFFPNTTSNLRKALHWYRRGHGFKSRRGLNFFSGLNFTTAQVVPVYHCKDRFHVYVFIRSSNI